MSFTGINSPSATDGTHVTVDTPTNTLLPPHALPESRVIPSALGVWGVSSLGVGYVDPAGASQGEQAAIGYDAMGGQTGGVPCFFLENVTDAAIRFSMDLSRPSDGIDVPVHAMPQLDFPDRPPAIVSRDATPPREFPTNRPAVIVSVHAMPPCASSQDRPAVIVSVHAMPPLEYQEVRK